MRVTHRMLLISMLALAMLANVVGRPASQAQPPPGLLVVNVTVKDPAQFEAYGAKTRPIVAAHKGVPVLRATNPTVLSGEPPHKALIAFRFPSKAAIKEFYSSADYQALIPLRTAAADAVFTAYEIAQEAPAEGKGLLAVSILVKDAAQFTEYGKATPPIVQAHGGKLQFRAINPEVLSGDHPYKALVLFRFPDQGAVRAFYGSEAYQKLIPMRTAAADTVFTGYDL